MGTELSKMNLPNIIVIESPRKRWYRKLTEHYQAKWILDLHNDVCDIEFLQRMDDLATLYVSSRYKPNVDEERIQLIREWVRRTYSRNKRGFYPVSVIDGDPLLNKPENLFGIELYPNNDVSKSIQFIKAFSQFLYVAPF